MLNIFDNINVLLEEPPLELWVRNYFYCGCYEKKYISAIIGAIIDVKPIFKSFFSDR